MRKLYCLLLPLVALIALASCRTAPQAETPTQISRERVPGTRGGAIVYRLSSPPRTLNPIMAADEASLIASVCLMSSKLIDFDHDTQSYVPGLVERWTRDADGRTIDCYLREGLRFSDGEPLTAEDAIFTLKAVYDERTATPILRDAMTFDGKQIELTAPDPRRLRFVFPEPLASPESYIFNLPILPRHKMEASLAEGALGQSWTVGSDPIGMASSGPFMLTESTPGERVVASRNPYYWKKDKNGGALPYLDSITLEVVSDLNNALARLSQGTLDLVDRIRPNDYAGLRDSKAGASGFDLGAGLAIDHVWFNLNTGTRAGKPVIDPVKRSWFFDARFRRAVSHAIDRDSIASFTLLGLATPLYGMLSPANRTWAASDLPRAEYNLDAARTLLKEAGFVQREESGGPRLFDSSGNLVEWTLLVPVENEPRKLMAAALQSELGKLGMTVHVAPIEFQALTERWSRSFDYDAILLGVSVTDTEPSSYANLLLSNSTGHQWHPKQASPATEWEARIDRLVSDQSREIDQSKRQALVRELQVVVAEQCPVIPIVSRHILVAARPGIRNYRPSNILPFSLWNADELFLTR